MGRMILTFSSISHVDKSFYCFSNPNSYNYCRVVSGHSVLRLSIWGLTLWDSCLVVSMLSSEVRMDNGRNRIAGIGIYEQVSDNKWSSEGYLSFLAKGNICYSQGGMEDVYRLFVNVYNPMGGLEFSLSNQMNAMFWVRKPKRVGLFALPEVTVTCEVASHSDVEFTHFIKVIMTQTMWLLTVIALVDIKVCLFWAESCD